MMNSAKQTGTAGCALYAMATVTCLVLGIDPVTVVPNQLELRPHLAKILDTGTITPFPVRKHRRQAERVTKVENVLVYCY